MQDTSFLPTPKLSATTALSAVLIFIFLLEIKASGGELVQIPVRTLASLGANVPLLTFGYQQYWRLLTAAFLHGGIIHIAFNVWVLMDIGSALERALNWGWTLTGFVVAAVVGSILSALMHAPQVTAIGASGGVFGLFAMAAVLAWLSPHTTGMPRDVLVRWLILTLVIGYVAGFDNWAHLGGVIGGALCGLLIAAMKRRRPLMERIGLVGGIASVALSVICIGFAGRFYRQVSNEAPQTPDEQALNQAEDSASRL